MSHIAYNLDPAAGNMSAQDEKSKSMADGSDAVFEFPCSPCQMVNSIEEGVHYCCECKQYLCAKCTSYHSRFPATAKHTLTDTTVAKKQNSGDVPLLPVAKCLTHPERDIEMYCATHDMVFCTLCIAKDHRSCSGVHEVGEVASSKVDRSKLQLLIDELDVLCKKLDVAKIKKYDNITKVKDYKKKFLSEIQEIRRKLVQHLDTLERIATSELDELCVKFEAELKGEVSTIEDKSACVRKRRGHLSIASQINDEQIFVHEKLGEKISADARSLLMSKRILLEKILTFTPDKIYETFMTAASIGHLQGSQVARLKRVQSKKEIDVKAPNDTQKHLINDICQLPDGTILVADEWNKSVKRLDRQYNIRDYCNFDSRVVSLTYCSVEDVVFVKLLSHKAAVLTAGSQLQIKRTIEMQGGNNYGLKACGDKLWVSSGCGIDICDLAGKIERRIEKDSSGKMIFNEKSNNISVSNDESTVFVAAWDSRVIAFDRYGNVKKELCDQRLSSTRGVTVSEDGSLFVSGYNSKNIVMFSEDGDNLGELVKPEDGMKAPFAIHYDQFSSQLFVGFADSKISVFELGE